MQIHPIPVVPATLPASPAVPAPPGQERIADWLRHSALFSHISVPALLHIASACTARTVPAGTMIFPAGTPADGFYVVVFGSVSLLLPGPGGAEKLVELIGPGECFGQAAMFLGIPFPVASRSQSETLLVHVPGAPIFELLEHDTALARKMLAGMALRMHRLIHDIEGYAFRSAASRLADYLLSLAAGQGDLLCLPVSKGVLASKLLITPETLSRVLKSWIAAGHIEVRGRRMTLTDRAALEAIARCDR